VQELRGRVAIVTGSGGGLGEAIVTGFAQAGISVVLAGRRHEKIAAVADRIKAAGGSAHAQQTDVTRESDVKALFAATIQTFGRLDILVNNAGVGSSRSETEDLSLELWENVVDTNLTGAFLCSREALKIMKAQRSGRIINIGSIAALTPRAHAAPYTASKAGLEGLTRSLALDGRAYNVSASIMHLGSIHTLDGFAKDRPTERKPTDYRLEPADIVRTALLMVSLPERATIFELTMLPIEQPSFIGRG
jgi:NAD(P)-dependent dehydrogenase (short-subunit alcohol dehydrogenase family)